MKWVQKKAIIITLIVTAIHIVLGWSISQLTTSKLDDNEQILDSLQMIEVTLGQPSEPEIEQEITPVIESKDSVDPEQVIAVKTAHINESDIVAKITPRQKTKAIVHKPFIKPKPAPLKPKKIITVVKSNTKINKTNENSIYPKIGNPNGNQKSQSLQGDSQINAALGAGFGNIMKGKCSSLSDEADDTGRVGVSVNVNEQGKATQVEITKTSGIKRLDNQAKRIATEHIYSPAKRNGISVAGRVHFNINFSCGNSAN